MGIVETALVLPMAAFDLAIVTRSIGTDELVTDAQFGGSVLKQRKKIPPGVGETIGELKAVVCLNTLDFDTAAGKPRDSVLEEVSGAGELRE